MIKIIPKPQNLTILPGEIQLSPPITLSGNDGTQTTHVHIASSYPQTFRAIPDGSAAQILLELLENLSDDLGEEGYRLEISSQRVAIQAAKSAGLFYGMQTLRQLLPLEASKEGISIPCLSIVDKPRFPWRGFMLDEARHFFGMDTVKK